LILDTLHGPIDKHLSDPDVATVLNDHFHTIFLHPRARPALTKQFGWPSITFVDAQGCIRSHGTPATSAAMISLINEALRNRSRKTYAPPPVVSPPSPSSPTHGRWIVDEPTLATDWVDPVLGVPALIFNDTPYLYGNRRDAEAVQAIGNAPVTAFLATLAPNAEQSPSAHPKINCIR